MKKPAADKKQSVDLPPKIEVKSVRHNFTLEERDVIGGDLARALGTLRGIDNEFEQVKASYKSKTAEAEAKLGTLETSRMNGFEMRNERCEVVYMPKERKKYYFLEGSPEAADHVSCEDMTNDDYQADLIQAESKFDLREEIVLFKPAEQSKGILVVGRLGGRWFSALRIIVGRQKLEERLDSEQASVLKRCDAVKSSAKRAQQWLSTTLGKDIAKGFDDSITAAVEAHKEREE